MLHNDTIVLTISAIYGPHPAVTFRHIGLDGWARAMRGSRGESQRGNPAPGASCFRATPPKNGAIFDTFF